MRRIIYPTDLNRFKSDYTSSFADLSDMKTKWTHLQNTYPVLKIFPQHLDDIMKADYSELINYYTTYHNIPLSVRESMEADLKQLFNYDGEYREIIKRFIMNPANGLEINTCHYCDMAYVNVYTIDPTEDGLYFMNTASIDELKSKLDTKSADTINKVIAKRPYKSVADFKQVGQTLKRHWKDDKFDKTFKPTNEKRSNFDIDHVLDKGSCPIIALSLMNFVPSCQVCNSRLKKTRVLGKLGIPEEKLSPSSPLYDFDNAVTIQILPKPGPIHLKPTQHPLCYETVFDISDKDYEYSVNLFKLKERYSYHIIEALRWIELKQKYDDARITMMSNALGEDSEFTVDKIREDIFGADYTKNEHRCFSKMKKDILK
ncbi:hypothetical protein DW228_06720 [Bacteroides fragilis]|uniref:HNH endonuclease n=1 Tax=Bacteroides fragilis TaxID=817 RepID=A0A396C4W4_BACFG|nr:hypothetical protein [Bacteroides fragilis]RHH14487.1 hypothetical protein DW228_06720 [Bacteroides fragilis]